MTGGYQDSGIFYGINDVWILKLILATRWYLAGTWSLALQWRHNGRNGVPNHHPHYCLLNRLKQQSSALRHWPLCGEFTGTGEFPAEMASNAENVSIFDDVIMDYKENNPIYHKTGTTERHKMDANSQTIFPDAFSWMKSFVFRLKFLTEVCS